MSPEVETLQKLGLSKSDILNLDPRLFTAAQKQAYIELLYGDPADWSWKNNLQRANSDRHRWNSLLGTSNPKGQPYRISHTGIAQAARRLGPASLGNDVTDFTDWIYRLYIPKKDYASLVVGERAEREIARRRISIPKHSGWKLIHKGFGENQDPAFDIPSMLVNEKPLRGSPDLVFRERKTDRILIVELKATDAAIPSNGWPNLRAQLWAYSQIPWGNVSDILLTGEIWSMSGRQLRAPAIRYGCGDEQFQRENLELFHCYGGRLQNAVR